jgi:hypothetical protein
MFYGNKTSEIKGCNDCAKFNLPVGKNEMFYYNKPFSAIRASLWSFYKR